MNNTGRRNFVRQALFGMGGLGLRALATGLPASLLARPLRARAQTSASAAPQFLLLSSSAGGDPVNVYVPGSYQRNISYSPDPAMAFTPVQMGSASWQVATPWASLPRNFWDRACFFHHATDTISHGDDLKVLDLMGGVRRGENIVSTFSLALQPQLGTVSSQPVPMDGETLTAAGMPQARLSPLGLKTSLLSQPGPLTDLRPLRDQTLDAVYALYKQYGTTAQRSFVDSLAQSQSQARQISDSVLSALNSLNGNDADNEILAAILIFKMKITPAVMVHIPFGGDNHSDQNLYLETQQHTSGVASINGMLQQLSTWGMQDQVTFAMLNVFGRSLMNSAQGRGHHGGHNVGMMMGKNVASSVVGGLVLPPGGSDYVASNIDSNTGQAVSNGDIAQLDSLGAFGQTLGVALGIPKSTIVNAITSGAVVKAAIAGGISY